MWRRASSFLGQQSRRGETAIRQCRGAEKAVIFEDPDSNCCVETHGMPGESRRLEIELDDADHVEFRPM